MQRDVLDHDPQGVSIPGVIVEIEGLGECPLDAIHAVGGPVRFGPLLERPLELQPRFGGVGEEDVGQGRVVLRREKPEEEIGEERLGGDIQIADLVDVDADVDDGIAAQQPPVERDRAAAFEIGRRVITGRIGDRAGIATGRWSGGAR